MLELLGPLINGFPKPVNFQKIVERYLNFHDPHPFEIANEPIFLYQMFIVQGLINNK
jgi:hypothetical protein